MSTAGASHSSAGLFSTETTPAAPGLAHVRADGVAAACLVSALRNLEAMRQACALSPEELVAAKRKLLRMDP